MNLESQIQQVRARLAEPNRADPLDDRFTDLEIIDWIHRAEIQVLRDIIDREKFTTYTSITLTAVGPVEVMTADSADDPIPADILDIVRVRVNGVEAVRIPLHELGALGQNRLRAPESGYQIYYYIIGGALGKMSLGIQPAVVQTDVVEIWYVKIPPRRYRHIAGAVTTVSADGTELIDAVKLLQPDDWWIGSEIRLISGIVYGYETLVTDFDQTTWTLTVVPSFPMIIPQGITYEMGESALLPEEYEDLILLWATYIGHMKDRDAQLAGIVSGEYASLLEKINSRYGYSRTEPARVRGEATAL